MRTNVVFCAASSTSFFNRLGSRPIEKSQASSPREVGDTVSRSCGCLFAIVPLAALGRWSGSEPRVRCDSSAVFWPRRRYFHNFLGWHGDGDQTMARESHAGLDAARNQQYGRLLANPRDSQRVTAVGQPRRRRASSRDGTRLVTEPPSPLTNAPFPS
jgi:hypothetical protein